MNLPSVNHKPLDFKKEKEICGKAFSGYCEKALISKKEIKDIFKQIDKDPFEFGETDCEIVCRCIFAGKKLSDIRPRAIATLKEYVANSRKVYNF
jgi:hypothetical protein